MACGSLIIWGFNFLVLKGIKQATIVNLIGTIAKIVPLLLFILVMAFVFNTSKFSFDFWGENLIGGVKLGSLSAQIKSTMLVTLWSFIGIEGAVVMSQHAKSANSVGKATLLGFVGCLAIYVLLSLLPFGYMVQSELSSVANPSTAGILEKIMGKSGAYIMNIGLLVSVLTSWLAWTMVTAQIPQAAAQNGTFPKAFQTENTRHAPSVSLYVTSAMMQVFMLLVYFSNNAWNTMLSITSVMVLPAYFSSCAYLWKLCEDHEYPANGVVKRSSALLAATFGCVYALWLIYVAGLKYLLAAVIFMALGIPVYIWARVQNKPHEHIFSKKEFCFALLLVLLALAAIYALMIGIIKL